MILSVEHGINRYVHYTRDGKSSQLEEEKKFADIVRELTGEWFTLIHCDKIQSKQRFYYDEVVYFGEQSDLLGSGDFAPLATKMSMLNRYYFDQPRAGFYFNSDPKCS